MRNILPCLFFLLALTMIRQGTCAGAEMTAPAWPERKAEPSITEEEKRWIEDLQPGTNDPDALQAMERLACLDGGTVANHFSYGYQDIGDTAASLAWMRRAVACGHVGAAVELGRLYFPLSGSLSSETFVVDPDFVLGYAWRAIGLSGPQGELSALEKKEGQTEVEDYLADRLRGDIDSLREELAGLDLLTLPSEKAPITAILAAWPESMPPEKSAATVVKTTPNPGPEEVLARIKGAALGNTGDAEALDRLEASGRLEDAKKEDALDLLRKEVGRGDAAAEYGEAWSMLRWGRDEKVMARGEAFYRTRAAKGDARAFVVVGLIERARGNDDEAVIWLEKAAETGNVFAERLLNDYRLDSGKDGKISRKAVALAAAEAGSLNALANLISVAEQERDVPGMYKWLTVFILRTEDPAAAYRARLLLAYVNGDETPEELRHGMEEGERWHAAHPPQSRSEAEF